jgi:alkanesulfonate monooxygenase SsuD/methylene tetrahydromethanopterin reductase-like flavin-dependent oxidoreductase (luciferase family)
MLRFGILTIQDQPWPILAGQWKTLERLGFDSLWIADHLVDPFRPDSDWLDGWSLLAALAPLTNKVRVGTLVTNFIYRHPALIAKQALALDHISNGRLELGLGATTDIDPSHGMTGTPVWDSAERVRRFREVVEIVDGMLRSETTDYEGRFYRVAGVHMHPPPVQRPRPPITVAAGGKTTLRIAARYGDAWNTMLGSGLSEQDALETMRRHSATLGEQCASIGRDPAEIRHSFLAGFTGDRPFASPDAFRDFVGRYREAGVDEFIFYYDRPGMDPEKHLTAAVAERFAGEVIPRLRRGAAA